MDKIDENLQVALEICSKTIGSEIKPLKREDIPNELSKLLSKGLYKVKGNGLDSLL